MPRVLAIVLIIFAAALLLYSQTWAFTGDEGFHLLAAQLIDHGRLPYIDFMFPQTPLNAYWNAFWMLLFGQTWRVTHVLAALFTAGGVALAAQFIYSRLPVQNWRTAAAVSVVLMSGLNVVVAEYGPLAQAYGICLFFTMLAFRIALVAVDRRNPWMSLLAGLTSGIAAGASLLTATFAPALALWLLVANRAGHRWLKLIAFAAGGALTFIPEFLLYLKSPDVVVFNLFKYHLFFRKLYWPETTTHDLEIITSWVDCGQALLLGLLATGAILYVKFRSGWEERLRSELYCCLVLAAAIAVELCTAHPTFARYFMLMVPFVSILASIGLMVLSSAVYNPGRVVVPVALIGFLFALGLGTSIHQRGVDIRVWKDYETIATKVREITPPGGKLFAGESIYFLLQQIPPPGLEFAYSHELDFGPKRNAALHIIPNAELEKRVAAGEFATSQTCDGDDIDEFKFREIYEHEAEVGECNVFWGFKKKK